MQNEWWGGGGYNLRTSKASCCNFTRFFCEELSLIRSDIFLRNDISTVPLQLYKKKHFCTTCLCSRSASFLLTRRLRRLSSSTTYIMHIFKEFCSYLPPIPEDHHSFPKSRSFSPPSDPLFSCLVILHVTTIIKGILVRTFLFIPFHGFLFVCKASGGH